MTRKPSEGTANSAGTNKKRRSAADITPERVRELLAFDALTGMFTWKRDVPHGPRKGEVAGYQYRSRYYRIRLDGVTHSAHRLAWMHFYGVPPKGLIDHKDGNGLNNQISNLRDASPAINSQNMRAPHSRNKVGLLGVRPSRHKYRADIRVDGKSLSVGTFETAEEAHAAYVDAKRVLHEGCTL